MPAFYFFTVRSSIDPSGTQHRSIQYQRLLRGHVSLTTRWRERLAQMGSSDPGVCWFTATGPHAGTGGTRNH